MPGNDARLVTSWAENGPRLTRIKYQWHKLSSIELFGKEMRNDPGKDRPLRSIHTLTCNPMTHETAHEACVLEVDLSKFPQRDLGPPPHVSRYRAETDSFERTHDRAPAVGHAASPRACGGLRDLTYPLHERDVVTACGRVCHAPQAHEHVLAVQRVGIQGGDEGTWIVSFMQYDLGYIYLEQKTLEPLDYPFGTGPYTPLVGRGERI